MKLYLTTADEQLLYEVCYNYLTHFQGLKWDLKCSRQEFVQRYVEIAEHDDRPGQLIFKLRNSGSLDDEKFESYCLGYYWAYHDPDSYQPRGELKSFRF